MPPLQLGVVTIVRVTPGTTILSCVTGGRGADIRQTSDTGQLGQGAVTPATVNISPPILGEREEREEREIGSLGSDKLLLSYPGPITRHCHVLIMTNIPGGGMLTMLSITFSVEYIYSTVLFLF